MRRLISYITGLIVLLGSIFTMYMPAMANTDFPEPPCALCITEEDLSQSQCDLSESDNDQHSIIDLPINGDCDCDISQTDNSASTGVLFSNAQNSKGAISPVLTIQVEKSVNYRRFNQINAPPASYLVSLNTVRQLK